MALPSHKPLRRHVRCWRKRTRGGSLLRAKRERADLHGPPSTYFPASRCVELPAAPIVSAIVIAGRSRNRRRGRRRSRSRLLVCRSRNAHRNGSDSQCKNECNFAHHHTLPQLLMAGYMADFQSSVCDISATASVLSSSTARLISAAFRRCSNNATNDDPVYGRCVLPCRLQARRRLLNPLQRRPVGEMLGWHWPAGPALVARVRTQDRRIHLVRQTQESLGFPYQRL